MTPEKAKQIRQYAQVIAALLYEETAPEQLKTFEGIETVVREQVLQQVSPEIGVFLSAQAQAPTAAETDS